MKRKTLVKNNRSMNGKRDTVVFLIIAGMIAGAVVFYVNGSDTAEEKAVAAGSWGKVEKIIEKKIGDDYYEVGQCTGFLYWCLNNGYGVDWGRNSIVKDLEDKLKHEEVTVVEKGRSGKVSQDMKPGDIVIFINGTRRSHCGILGDNGRLYHAISSGVDGSMTLSQWMALPDRVKNCDRYIVYRGLR